MNHHKTLKLFIFSRFCKYVFHHVKENQPPVLHGFTGKKQAKL